MERPSPASRGTLTLDADTLSAAKLRAAALGFRINIYIGILIRNELLQPLLARGAAVVESETKRAELPLSLPRALRRRGSRRAAQLEMNFSRFVEALINRDLGDSQAPLLIYPEK